MAEGVAAEAGGVVERREMVASGDGERLMVAPGGGCRRRSGWRRSHPGHPGYQTNIIIDPYAKVNSALLIFVSRILCIDFIARLKLN